MIIGETTLFFLLIEACICGACLYSRKSQDDTPVEVTPKPVQEMETALENALEEADTYEPPEPPAYVDVIK